jgi:hypothetical protein
MKRMSGWAPADREPLSDQEQRALRARAEKCLPRALELLKPRTLPDRLEGGAAILRVAEDFVRWRALAASSPSAAAACKELDELARWADEGLGRLDSLGPWLLTTGALPARDLGSKRQDLETLRDDAKRWAQRVGGKPGQSPLWPAPPKRELVVECLNLFERCRPGEASTRGDFARFVAELYQLAAGEIADLERPIKDVMAEWGPLHTEIAAWERSREGRQVKLLELNSRKLELQARIGFEHLDENDRKAARRELETVEKEYAGVLADLSESGI